MEKELLNKEQFNRVEVPDFLYERIKEKIEHTEQKSTFQSRLMVAAVIIVLIVNIGVISQYNLNQNTDNLTDLNPYSLNTLYD